MRVEKPGSEGTRFATTNRYVRVRPVSTFASRGFTVYTGTRGSLHNVAGCGAVPYIFDAKRGVTYYIEVLYSADTLEFLVGQAFGITQASVDGTGTVDATTGAATIGGTIACNGEGDALINIDLSQRVNSKVVAEGVLSLFPTCPTTSTSWSGTVVPFFGPSSGPFRPGPATITVTTAACGTLPGSFFSCDSKTVTQTVLLRPRK
jgi:hypothetical protein